MLDEKIKNWAYGKEGNLQALLCSLQHVMLYPIPTLLLVLAIAQFYFRKLFCPLFFMIKVFERLGQSLCSRTKKKPSLQKLGVLFFF